MRWIAVGLVCSFALGFSAPALAAGPTLTRLADGVEAAAVLERQRVLVLGTDGALSTVDYATGARDPWQCSWTPRGAGWDAPDAPLALPYSRRANLRSPSSM
jgi:hypothetical protein